MLDNLLFIGTVSQLVCVGTLLEYSHLNHLPFSLTIHALYRLIHPGEEDARVLRVAAGLARQLIALGLGGIYPGAPHNPKIMSLRMLHIFLNEFSELWAPEASRPRPTSLRGGTPGVLRLDQFDPLPADFWDRRTVYALMGTSAVRVTVEMTGYAIRGSGK